MKLHFFVKEDIKSATSRYRGYLMSDFIKKTGIESVVYKPVTPFSFYKLSWMRLKSIFEYIKIMFAIKNGEVIYLVRTIYSVDFILVLIFFKIFFLKKIIFDFDDPKFFTFPVRMKLLTKVASGVCVGSHYLYDWSKKYNDNVYLIPTSVPFEGYFNSSKLNIDRYSSGTLVIGWLGYGPTHIDNLKILHDPLLKLLMKGYQLELWLAGVSGCVDILDIFKPLEKRGLHVRYFDDINWSDVNQIAGFIKNFDIGVMPLVRNEWNLGKCSFKAIEYMACGVPAVISPVGENNFLIRDGFNGMLANQTDDWVKCLELLLLDKSMRFNLGQAGAETIKKDYSLESNHLKIIDLINKL